MIQRGVETGVGAGVETTAAEGSIGATAIVTKIASAIKPTTAAIKPRLRFTACGQFSTSEGRSGVIGW
jgi:hypothetical protein